VFLPGWEDGLFPHQRSLDENGLAGLEEERRLAYVGLTRARRRAKVSFAQNRRNRGLFQAATPSSFVDELAEAHVDVIQARGPFSGVYGHGGGTFASPYGRSRFDEPAAGFQSSYQTPGWQRAQQQWKRGAASKRASLLIEGELVASSSEHTSSFKIGARVFHQKFGYGLVAEVDGNKLTIDFDKAGRKKVVDSFVETT
jgi:DNA helicase II / ATP-dependent DNA helicase PcrA